MPGFSIRRADLVEKRGFRRGLSIGRGALMEEWRFRRELSTETGLFMEKLRMMLGLSAGRLDFVEIKTLKKYSVMNFEFITECFSEDHIPAKAGICYSSLKLSDFVDYLDATDRTTARLTVADHIRATTE